MRRLPEPDMNIPFMAVQLDDTRNWVLEEFARTTYSQLLVLNEEGTMVASTRQEQVISRYH